MKTIQQTQGYSNSNQHFLGFQVTGSPSIITSVQLILMFDVTIPNLSHSYTSPVIINASPISSSTSVDVYGTLVFANPQPINAITYSSSKPNPPPYLQNFQYITDYATIKANVLGSNYQSQASTQKMFTVTSGTSSATSFTGTISLINKQTEMVTYYATFLETLKNAFSQYISVWLVTYVLGTSFLMLLAKNYVYTLEKEEFSQEMLNAEVAR